MRVQLDSAIEHLERVEADYLAELLSTEAGVAALVRVSSWLGNLLVAAGRRDEAVSRFALAHGSTDN